MDAKKPSKRSQTRSSAAASKAGSEPKAVSRRAPGLRAGAAVGALSLLERVAAGDFPASVYLEGPDEALKAAFLAEFRRAWAAAVPEAPASMVMRPGEHDV